MSWDISNYLMFKHLMNNVYNQRELALATVFLSGKENSIVNNLQENNCISSNNISPIVKSN